MQGYDWMRGRLPIYVIESVGGSGIRLCTEKEVRSTTWYIIASKSNGG